MSRDRVSYRKPAQVESLLVNGGIDSARNEEFPIYEALVVDVIVDHYHKDYSPKDGYNVGAIKVRIFDVNPMMIEEKLPWADPIDITLYEMPLKGEVVTLFKCRSNLFYTKKIPIAHRVQENAMLKLNEALDGRPAQSVSAATTKEDELTIEKHKFGEYFKPDSRVRQLRHFEGDTILQGRMGNTIRFGSSKMDPTSKGMAPNIILRTGQAKDVEINESSTAAIFGLIMEDPENDVSSIWMTADQAIPFRPITREASSIDRSILNPIAKYDKASILITSDKVVLNAKQQNIMMFAHQDIYLNSLQRIGIDTDESILMSANFDLQVKTSRNADFVVDEDFTVKAGSDISLMAVDKSSVVSKKIYLGSVQNDVEPVVGGTSLSIFLARLITVLMGNGIAPPQIPYQATGAPIPTTIPPPPAPGIATFSHVITPVGPGQLNPAIVAGLIALYAELALPNPGSLTPLPFSGAPFNSYDVFVKLANEDPTTGIVLNEFKPGKSVETKNNMWKLTDPYYKVV